MTKHQTKIKILIFTLTAVLLNMLLFILPVLAQSLTLPEISNYQGSVQDPGTIQSFDTGVASLIVGFVMNVRYILGAIAIVSIVYAGFRLVIGQGSEEEWTKQKKVLVWSIAGLGTVGLAGELVRVFAVGKCAELGMLPGNNNMGCVEGGFLKDPNTIIQRTTIFNQTVQYMIMFVKYTIGGVAVASLVISALKMVGNSAGDELEKAKKNLITVSLGLIILIVADPIINNVLFSVDKTRYPTGGVQAGINVVQGVKEIVGFTNYLVTILSPLAILLIIYGGFMYILSGGDAEKQGKAKKIIIFALIGLIIVYGAFAIVSTFINGQYEATSATAVEQITPVAVPVTTTGI
jgi:hypothetical protein